MTATDTAEPTSEPTSHAGPTPASVTPAPTPTPPAPGSTGEGDIAGFGDRALALILDTIVVVFAFAVIGNWAAFRWGGVTTSGFELAGLPAAATLLLTGLVCFLYYWILEGLFGATFGKAIVGIRVRRVDGGKADFHASLVRNLLRIVDGFAVYLVGWIIAAFSRLRQRLGDRVAGTVVVRGPGTRNVRIAGGVALAGAVIAGVVAILSIRRAGAETGALPRAAASGGATSVAATAARGSGLKLADLTWTEGADGPPHTGPYTPGSHLFAKYQITGFAHGPQGQVKVAMRILSVDPNGLALGDSLHANVDATDATGAPIYGHFDIGLPDYVPPGAYAVRIRVRDAIGGQDATFASTFSINAPAVAPADKLEMRGLGLSTTEGGPALSQPVFHAGETLYFTGRAFGVRFRDSVPDFHVDVLLLGPSGSTILGKTDWGQLTAAVNYRPPTFFVPLSGTVTLPGNVGPGAYVIRVGLRDLVAQTSLNADAPFEVH